MVASVYAAYAISVVPRLLSQLDREPDSVSYGSFDREHWGWKFRDFPLTMLQAATVPLALLWRYPFTDNAYYQNGRVLEWIEAAVVNTLKRQHRNGGFDSVGPNTQDHGVSLAMVHFLSETSRILGDVVPAALRDRVKEAVRQSCRFALQSREDYAFISNHHALFAMAYLNASELVGEASYLERAELAIDTILHEQSPDGWYREYGGPDPGYESLGIFYLARYWSRTGSGSLLQSLRNSVEFFAHCVHPDGSLGGMYGSRHTQLYYPAGFETLACAIPLAASVARFMAEHIASRDGVSLRAADAENLPVLAHAYLEACLASERRNETVISLPCEALDGVRCFPDAGIRAVGNERYYAVFNASKGGVCRIFDKQTRKLAYEDAGYVVRAAGHIWTSQLIGLGRLVEAANADEFSCETRFAEVRQELPTPSKYLLLRALNLTLFRIPALAIWLRRLIIGRLITARRPGPFRLQRMVRFKADEIQFSDRLEATQPIRVEAVSLPRSFMAIHMGSAKYFDPAELESTPQIPVDGLACDLNRRHAAMCEFTVNFRSGSSAPGAATEFALQEEVIQR